MIENIPLYIPITFILTTLLTLFLSYWIVKSSSSKKTQGKAVQVLVVMSAWLVTQGTIAFNNIYHHDTDVMPPKIFLFGVFPAIILCILLFLTSAGRRFVNSLPLKQLAYLNIVRIPVELVLLWLFFHGVIPEIMTFDGWNFDILAGITAPLIIYYGFVKRVISYKIILIWNICCFLLLVGVFTIALLSAPFPLQQLAFSQPNVGLLYFPYSLLPTFIVPIVMLGHLVSIRKLKRKH